MIQSRFVLVPIGWVESPLILTWLDRALRDVLRVHPRGDSRS